MRQFLLLASALVQIVTSLKCHSCDSFISCSQPFFVDCPETDSCYTVKDGNQVVLKGCVHSCKNLNVSQHCQCETCRHSDFCNSPVDGDGNGVHLELHPPEGSRISMNESKNASYKECSFVATVQASGVQYFNVAIIFLATLLVY